MSAFLLLLVKLNLAMGMAIILVALLRHPLRRLFGAPIAYAIWLLVPVAALASLLPPRAAAPVPILTVHGPAPESFITHIAPALTAELPRQISQAAIVAAPAATSHAPLLFFAAWMLGALLMASYLGWLQRRFYAAARRGHAGPAVLGFLRPRIITPDGFRDHFTPQEQAAILTHEHVHLARQDARINALAALFRCLCWFNPLVHLGARWLRIDQELACDATAVAGAISRRDYAEALLKSQMAAASLPLGCNWPGSQHPLIERIALLKRPAPGTARRVAGMSFIIAAASFAGLAAWAAQPPAAAKPLAATLLPMAVLRAPDPARTAAAEDAAANANPASSDHEVAAPASFRSDRAISRARVQAPSTDSIRAEMESTLAALPQPTPVSLALNAPGAARTFTTPSTAGTGEIVMANTPTGAGDPNTIVCRAPQRFGNGQFGPEACGHNYEWRKLAMNGKDLAADGKTLIDKPTVDNPKGEGDPDAVTCRTPQFIAIGPLVKVCETNRFWADIAKNHKVVDARGVVTGRPLPRGCGEWCAVGNNSNNSWIGHDSGQPWQSSQPNPATTP